LHKLRKIPEFAAYVDEVTMATGIATKGERMRIIKQVIADKIANGLYTKKDLLDWVKLAGEVSGDTVANGPNITIQITQQMQQLPAAERPAAFLNLARGLVQGLNTIPGIVRHDPDVIDGSDEEEVDLMAGDGGEHVESD
jgi:hypothetical protein